MGRILINGSAASYHCISLYICLQKQPKKLQWLSDNDGCYPRVPRIKPACTLLLDIQEEGVEILTNQKIVMASHLLYIGDQFHGWRVRKV